MKQTIVRFMQNNYELENWIIIVSRIWMKKYVQDNDLIELITVFQIQFKYRNKCRFPVNYY